MVKIAKKLPPRRAKKTPRARTTSRRHPPAKRPVRQPSPPIRREDVEDAALAHLRILAEERAANAMLRDKLAANYEGHKTKDALIVTLRAEHAATVAALRQQRLADLDAFANQHRKILAERPRYGAVNEMQAKNVAITQVLGWLSSAVTMLRNVSTTYPRTESLPADDGDDGDAAPVTTARSSPAAPSAPAPPSGCR